MPAAGPPGVSANTDPDVAASVGPGWDSYLDRLVAAETGQPVNSIDFDDYYPGLSDHSGPCSPDAGPGPPRGGQTWLGGPIQVKAPSSVSAPKKATYRANPSRSSVVTSRSRYRMAQ